MAEDIKNTAALQQVSKQDIENFTTLFEKQGYFFSSKRTLQQVYLAANYYKLERKGLSGILLAGEPGVGKSFLAETLANVLGFELLQYQCVATTTDEQLFATINTPGVVAHDPEKAISPGILTQAIKKVNNNNKVVLLVDEIDKANENIDPFFLSFMQSGFCWTPEYGMQEIEAEKRKNLIVVVCKNKWRDLDGSLLRRLRRVDLELPTLEAMQKIIDYSDNGYNKGMKQIALKLYAIMRDPRREELSRVPSAQEIINALNDDIILEAITGTAAERMDNLVNWFANNADDLEIVKGIIKDFAQYDISKEMQLKAKPLLAISLDEANKLLNDNGIFFIKMKNAVIQELAQRGINALGKVTPLGILKIDEQNNVDLNMETTDYINFNRLIMAKVKEEITIPQGAIKVVASKENSYIASLKLGNHYLLLGDKPNFDRNMFLSAIRGLMTENEITLIQGKYQTVGANVGKSFNAILEVDNIPRAEISKGNFWPRDCGVER